MKRVWLVLILLSVVCVPLSQAKNRHNHIGQLVRMETVHCGPEDSGGVAKAIFGSQVPGPAGEEPLCPEYILQSEGLYYRIRPRDHKHPAILPIGEEAQFRFQRDRLVLQIEDFGDEAYEFSVLAIIPESHSESFRPPAHIIIGPPQ